MLHLNHIVQLSVINIIDVIKVHILSEGLHNNSSYVSNYLLLTTLQETSWSELHKNLKDAKEGPVSHI